jgi:xanthine dehydrogenase YagT iron-sulfur-binding subunit
MPITINGAAVPLPEDPRVSLLDHLREHLHLTGTKKGCNQGACGACTVLVDGQRIISCLALAIQYDGGGLELVAGITGPAARKHARLRRHFVAEVITPPSTEL